MLELKRQFDHTTGKPVCTGVKVLRSSPRQHFSQRFMDGGIKDGWLTFTTGQLVIEGVNGNLVYLVERPPGYYCCHCNEPMADGGAAQDHISKYHPGKPSPDPGNPAGYRCDNFYACIRIDQGKG
jgi:hypothetical protein